MYHEFFENIQNSDIKRGDDDKFVYNLDYLKKFTDEYFSLAKRWNEEVCDPDLRREFGFDNVELI